MKCSFCGGPAHPATGSQLGKRTIACRRCNDEFWAWAKAHTNKRPRRKTGAVETKDTFYEAAGKNPPRKGDKKMKTRATRTSRATRRGNPGTRNFFPQSILFDRRLWAKANAVAWALRHGYKATKIDPGKNFWRLRQADPDVFVKGTFATVEYGKGIKAIFARAK